MDIVSILQQETGLQRFQVEQTVALLEGGATVPFIARYRKEATGELDEVMIRSLEERLTYLKEFEERRRTILKTIEEQGKLTPELSARILDCRSKTELEDLYAPFKPRRRTRATIAREKGLEPLAESIINARGPVVDLREMAAAFVDPERDIQDPEAALQGAGYILAEDFADTAEARALVRQITWEKGVFRSEPARGKEETVSKYEMYYDFSEALKEVPSHRMLAMRRGENEGFLRLHVEAPGDEIINRLAALLIPEGNPCRDWLEKVVSDSYKRLIAPSIEVELRLQAKRNAEEEAILVFATNLRNLLLSGPAGTRRVLGIDPGLRTGSKLAVVDETGRFLDHATIYPHTGGARAEAADMDLLQLIRRHNVEMVAIGNGTAGREMDRFVRQCLKESGVTIPVVMVSEAGASVYSASDIAREEFPDLDLTVRGAISIARRLQDPLAELVKVEPKSIGVGQYQHDVNQSALKTSLDRMVESCVNYVGVDLNTASWALLGFVSGVGENLAKSIVRYRDEHGVFSERKELLNVPRFGPKSFEQAAGFLRIRDGAFPLDNTAVHPERYALVERMAKDAGVDSEMLISRPDLLEDMELTRYIDEDVGLPTLRDILAELKKPGRDPRDSFVETGFRDDVMEIGDLEEGMTLNGIVTNVAAFGAFVDVGVHQDGLVHISRLADKFVKDPGAVVRVGQKVKVLVLAVDLERKRISLSMRNCDFGPERPGDAPLKPAIGSRPAERTKQAPLKKKTDIASALEKAGFRVRR